MARRPRVHFPGALDHVISRGNQRQKVYRDERDYRRFKTLLGEMGKRHGLSTLSLAVKRLEEKIQKDSKLRRRLKEVSARLRQGHVRQYQISKA
jgi:putative transposase